MLSLALTLSLALGQASETRPLPEEALEPAAHALAALRAAHASGTNTEAPRRALREALDALAAGSDAVDLLARPTDLGRALALAEAAGRGRAPRAGKVEEARIDAGSFAARPLVLAYRLPKANAAPPRGYPVVLTLPEAGEKPIDHVRERWSSRAALEGWLVLAPGLPDPAATGSKRAASAPTPEDDAAVDPWTQVAVAGRPGGVAHALAALRFARERFPIDPDRVLLVGAGAAAPAALATADYGPHLFSGVALRSADPSAVTAHNFRNLPTLFVGGGAGADAFAARLQSVGFDNCTRVPVLDEPALLAWAAARPRAAAPTTVSLTVGKPYPTRVAWLRVAPNAPDTAAMATVDRERNAVRVLASGASAVTLHLSDALLDHSRPVTVDFEGRTVEVEVRRDLATCVARWLDGTSDPGAPYVAELVLAPGIGTLTTEVAPPQRDVELDERLAAAEAAAREADRADPLWELVLWCRATGRAAREAELTAKVLRFEPDHAAAREAAGHVRAPVGAAVDAAGEWFTSREALDHWRARQDPAVAAGLGHVLHAGRYVHPRERDRWSRGWRKDPETGLWWTPEDRRRVRRGAARQDLEWLDAEGAARADAGLWRVAGEWLPLAAANRRHAELQDPWRIPAWHAELVTTVDREVALRALAAMEDALPALHRVFGVEPELPLRVAVLRDEEQYDRFAFGDPDGRRAAAHTGRLHTVHSAFFAESWFPLEEGARVHRGMGVGYWDVLSPNGDAYGYHAARLAFALSYVDALDPSPKAVQKALANGPDAGFAAAYEAEKGLPRWLRIGGAVYAERFFEDPRAAARGDDPWWARKWSLDNLARQGGLTSVDDVLRGALDPDDRLGALRRMLEMGALVAFVVDGGQPALSAAHEAVVAGLRAGRVRPADLRALEDALRAHGPAFGAFVKP